MNKIPSQNYFIRTELEKYTVIREDKKRLVVAHYFKQVDLRQMGRALTTEEKCRLGIPEKRRLTTAMVELVEPAFLPIFDIDEGLRLIVDNAKNKYRLIRSWHDLITDSRVHWLLFSTPMDNLTCNWCKSTHNKPLRRRFKLLKNLEQNCNCLWFRGQVQQIATDSHQMMRQEIFSG